MLTHATPVRLLTATLVVLLSFLLIGSSAPSFDASTIEMTKTPGVPVSVKRAMGEQQTSMFPILDVEGGTTDQRERLALAVSRFRDAGLALPDLAVVFASTDDACQGHYGLYENDRNDPRITFCSDTDFVYEHELAHAWEAHSATDAQRASFMDVLGFATWADPDVTWSDRGIEGAAFTIQQTVGGMALPIIRTDAFRKQSAAYTALTGMQDHRLDG